MPDNGMRYGADDSLIHKRIAIIIKFDIIALVIRRWFADVIFLSITKEAFAILRFLIQNRVNR